MTQGGCGWQKSRGNEVVNGRFLMMLKSLYYANRIINTFFSEPQFFDFIKLILFILQHFLVIK